MGRNDDLLDQSLPREIPMKRGLLRCSSHVLSFRVPDFKWCLYKYVCTVTVCIYIYMYVYTHDTHVGFLLIHTFDV